MTGASPGRLILVSSSLSALGDGFRFTALPLLVLALGSGPQSLSTAYVVNSLPGLLFVLFGGLLSDRLPPRRLVVGLDLARGVLAAVFTAALFADVVGIGAVYALIFVLATAEVLYFSAMQVFIADSLEKRDLATLNGRVASGTTTANSLAGPAGGALLFAANTALPFLVDAVTFLVAAACNALVPRHRAAAPAATASADPTPAAPRPSVARQLGEGFRVTFTDFTMRWFFVFAVARGVGTAGLMSVLAAYVVTERGLPVSHYGYALTIGAVGGVAGGWLVSRLGDRFDVWRSTWVGNVTFGLSIVVIPFATTAWTIGVLLAVNLGAAVWTAVVAATLRQRVIERSSLGRASSVLRLGVGAATLAGAGAVWLLADSMAPSTLTALLGLSTLVACAPAIALRRPAVVSASYSHAP